MPTLTISLDTDTMAFLVHCNAETDAFNPSGFINSLLRQERFRQGYPAHTGAGSQLAEVTPIGIARRLHGVHE